jgi:predicted outer membrane repeat protein
VNSAEDSGTGSLREALINAADYDLITIASTLTGETITLTSRLPDINKIITIEGNGVILSGSGITQIMNIAGGEVSIRRVHFRDGTTTNLGGAIVVAGTLNLESCIFSGNRATSRNGGAIYTYGTLTVSGCTFYGNTANSTSSAIYNNSGMLTLTGNLFYGNTASGGYNVVYSPGTTINSGSYNVSDYASGTNITTGSGWTFDTTDQQVTGITFDGAFTPSSATNLKIITPSLPTGFPATYFDGSPRDVPATPGAMAAAP